MLTLEPTAETIPLPPSRTAIVCLTAVVLGLAFYLTEHEWLKCLEEPPSSAAEMEDMAAVLQDSRWGGKIAFSSIAALGVLLLIQKAKRPIHVGGPLHWLVFSYVLWCAASVAWSDEPMRSCRGVVVLAFCLLGALGISRALTTRDLCLLALLNTIAYAALGIFNEAVLGQFQPWAAGYRFMGTTHANVQGDYCAIIVLAAVCLAGGAAGRRWPLIALGAAGAGLLLLTRSRTAVAALAIALLAIWWRRGSFERNRLVLCALAGVACVVALMVALSGSDLQQTLSDILLLGRQEEAGTLTGRVPIWTTLLPYVAQHPWIGHGYSGFWTPETFCNVAEGCEIAVAQAHSAFVETLLGVGLIGALPLLLAVALAVRRAASRYGQTNDAGDCFVLGLIVFGVVNGALESGFVQPFFLSFVAACCLMRLAAWPDSLAREPIRPKRLSHDASATHRNDGHEA